MIDNIIQTIVGGYDSLLQTFGSPIALLALSATLVAIALLELCVRKQNKTVKEAN